MFSFGEVIALMAFACVLFMCGVLVGGWLVFKGKNSVPGESFIGGIPKGEAYTIPDGSENLMEEAEKSVMERTEAFLKRFVEGGNK